MKLLALILFAVTAVFQWLVPIHMIKGKEDVLKNGTAFYFKTQPIDPVDYMRGRYINLYFENDDFRIDPSKNNFTYNQKLYVTFAAASTGEAFITGVSEEKPLYTSDYIRTNVYSYTRDSIVQVYFPFDKFYMEENKAPVAEKIYSETNRDSTKKCFAQVFIKDGEFAVSDVLIDGKSIRDLAGTSN